MKLILLDIIISKFFEYIRISLKLILLLYIYIQSFDQTNFTYIVLSIKNLDFKDLIFVISNIAAIYNIPKTIKFVDSIKDIIAIIKSLYSKFIQ